MGLLQRNFGTPCLATLSQVVGVTNTYHPLHVPFQQNGVGTNVLRGTPPLDSEMNHVWSYSNMMTILSPFANV